VAIVDPDTGKLVEKSDFLAHAFEHDEADFDTAVPVIQKVLTTATKEDLDPDQTEALISNNRGILGAPQVPPQATDHPRHHRRMTRVRSPGGVGM
jgi:hypothetical protein